MEILNFKEPNDEMIKLIFILNKLILGVCHLLIELMLFIKFVRIKHFLGVN